MKKIMQTALFLMIFTLSLLVSPQAMAAETQEITDAKAYVQKVNEVMNGLDNYHTSIVIMVKSPFIQAKITNSGDFLLKPLRYKNLSECVMTDLQGKETRMNMLQYMRQSGDQIVAYTQADGKWTRQSMPYRKEAQQSFYDVTSYTHLVKAAEIKAQTAEVVTIGVTIDSQILKELSAQMLKDSKAEEMSMFSLIFRDMGDISYVISVDKKTNRIISMDMDLSDLMKKSIVAAIDHTDMPIAKKAQIKQLTKDIEMILHGDNTAFNQVESFEIPQAVIESAVEAPLKKSL